MRKKLNCIILVLAVGLSSVSITTASTDIGDWSEDVRLTFNDARSIFPAIAVEGNNVHVAYIDDEGAGYLEMFLWYINSSDRGNTWNSPVCLVKGPSTRALRPKIAVNGSNIHVIWCEINDKKIHYIRSTDNGNTWSTEIAITPMMYDNVANWDIGVYENNLHVVYVDLNYKLSYVQSSDNGLNWSSPRTLVPSISKVSESAIAVNGNNIHIAFRVRRTKMGKNVGEILYTRSIDGGVNWDTEINISVIPGIDTSCHFPDIAVTQNDIFVVYRDTGSGRNQIYYCHSSDNGFTWKKGIRLSNSPSFVHHSTIAAEGDKVFTVWEDNRDDNSELYFKNSFDRSSTWSNDTRLTVAPETSVSPDIAITENIIHVVWTDHRDGNAEIYYKQYLIPLMLIRATIDIYPDTLNLKSKGRWVTVYIELPEGYDVNDINVTTILFEDVIPAENHHTDIGDYDNDNIPDLMVKFDRSEVEDFISNPRDSVSLKITGDLTTNESFEGSDIIRAILPP